MSARDGALDAVCPVAAHMPGGGEDWMSLRLAARILLEIFEEAVPDRSRVLESAEGLEARGLRASSGGGKGEGAELSGLEAEPEPESVFGETIANGEMG